MHHGKHHSRVDFVFFYLFGFFFYVVGAVEFGSLACRGALELCEMLVQLFKYILTLAHVLSPVAFFSRFIRLLYKIIGPPHLGDGNTDFFIATGCDAPGFELFGEVV